MDLQNAINWAISQLQENESPQDHGFVDLIRKHLNDNSIEYPPISFEDVKPYLQLSE